MSPTTPNQTERLVQFSRRQLWFVLIALVMLGAGHMVDMLAPSTHVPVAVAVVISLVISVVFLAAIPKTAGIDVSSKSPGMRALQHDELRQLACAKAFRNGFFVLLAYPPLCAFALTGLAVANPMPVVVESGAWLGAVTCLASLLWYDR